MCGGIFVWNMAWGGTHSLILARSKKKKKKKNKKKKKKKKKLQGSELAWLYIQIKKIIYYDWKVIK